MTTAFYAMNNFGGVEILGFEFDSENRAKWRIVGMEQRDKEHKSKVYETATGRAYIRPYGQWRLYLDDCMMEI